MTLRTTDLGDPEFRYDDSDPVGFRSGAARVGEALGSQHIGVKLYELPPGQAVCPLHWEAAEEEFAMALDGPMWVRTGDEIERVEAMQMAYFPRGPEGVHQVRNDGDRMVRVLMFGEVSNPGATVYPDSGKVGVWSKWDEADGCFVQASKVPYFHGEPIADRD